MRQGQQNRRGRGRNRKSQNPLTRSFESNGPDVKIRGTPAHIAEKYVSMARDALSSGDPVLAENYLQHAEHYNRIIMSYREQQSQVGDGNHNGPGRSRDGQDDAGDSDNVGEAAVNGHAEAVPRGHEPQPTIVGDDGAEQPRNTRRGNGHDDGRRRQSQPSSDQGDDDGEAAPRERRPRRRERYAQRDDQPDFLKRPIRKPRRSANAEGNGEANAGDEEGSSATDGEAEADNAA